MVHSCLAVTSHLHFWQNDRDLLRVLLRYYCYFGEPIPKQELAQKVDTGEETSTTAAASIRIRELSITSPALRH